MNFKYTIMQFDSFHSLLQKDGFSALKNLYGTNPDVIAHQAERYSQLAAEFKSKFNTTEFEVFSSPGRTEIGGNHTDHNFGRVLAGAVNLDNIAMASANGTMKVRIVSAGYPSFEVDLNNLKPDSKEFFTSESLIRGISARMKELGYTIGGFDAVIDGGVPKGSGLSSSASFEVLIGAIISHLFNQGKLDPIENAIIGQYAENVFFGKPCGLMDQTACSVGGLVTIDFKNPAEPIVNKVDFDFT